MIYVIYLIAMISFYELLMCLKSSQSHKLCAPMPLWLIFLTQATNNAYPTIRARPCEMQSKPIRCINDTIKHTVSYTIKDTYKCFSVSLTVSLILLFLLRLINGHALFGFSKLLSCS